MKAIAEFVVDNRKFGQASPGKLADRRSDTTRLLSDGIVGRGVFGGIGDDNGGKARLRFVILIQFVFILSSLL